MNVERAAGAAWVAAVKLFSQRAGRLSTRGCRVGRADRWRRTVVAVRLGASVVSPPHLAAALGLDCDFARVLA